MPLSCASCSRYMRAQTQRDSTLTRELRIGLPDTTKQQPFYGKKRDNTRDKVQDKRPQITSHGLSLDGSPIVPPKTPGRISYCSTQATSRTRRAHYGYAANDMWLQPRTMPRGLQPLLTAQQPSLPRSGRPSTQTRLTGAGAESSQPSP